MILLVIFKPLPAKAAAVLTDKAVSSASLTDKAVALGSPKDS